MLFNSENTRYLFLLVCVICPKSNEVVENSSYANSSLLYGKRPAKNASSPFSVFSLTFDKKIMKKATIFNFLQISTMLQNFTFW